MFTIHDQIKCVQRELALRRNFYRRRVAAGQMRQASADTEPGAMEAVLATLERVRERETGEVVM